MIKKVFIIFTFCLSVVTYASEINNYDSKINKSNITTGYLADKSPDLLKILNQINGKNESVCDLFKWQCLLGSIKKAAIDTKTENQIKDLNELNKIIFSKNLEYQEISFALIDFKINKLKTEGDDQVEDVSIKAFTVTKNETYNKQIKFNLTNDLLISNIPITNNPYCIDFDDGYGFRKFRMNESVTISYNNEGKKFIKLKNEDGTIITSELNIFKVNTNKGYLQPNTTLIKQPSLYNLANDIPADNTPAKDVYNSIYNNNLAYFWGAATNGDPNMDINKSTGLWSAFIFLGRGNTTITKPIIVCERLVDQNGEWGETYSRINQNYLADHLLDLGYDIIIFEYYGGNGVQIDEEKNNIGMSALSFATLIKTVNESKLPANQGNSNVVIGLDVGGVITNVSLAWMEFVKHMDYNISLMITVDSPHQGANIPLSYQKLIHKTREFFLYSQYADNYIFHKMMIQLLYSHVMGVMPEAHEQSTDSPLLYRMIRGEFKNDYQKILKYLKYGAVTKLYNTHRIAVSNGSGLSLHQFNVNGVQAQAGDNMLSAIYDGHTVNTWSSAYSSSTILNFDGTNYSFDPSLFYGTALLGKWYPLDMAPGCYDNIIEKVFSHGYIPNDQYTPSFTKYSYVSTVSALDVRASTITYMENPEPAHPYYNLYALPEFYPSNLPQYSSFNELWIEDFEKITNSDAAFNPANALNKEKTEFNVWLTSKLFNKIKDYNVPNDLIIDREMLFYHDMDLKAKNSIQVGGGFHNSQDYKLGLKSGNEIILNPGTFINLDGEFKAEIQPGLSK